MNATKSFQIIAIIVLTMAACNPAVGSQPGSPGETQTAPPPLDAASLVDICATPAPAWLDLDAAASAPAFGLIEPGTPPVMGAIGSQGASALAAGMAPQGTFCSLDISTDASQVISEALELIRQNKKAEARRLLESLLSLSFLSPPAAAKLASPAMEPGPSPASRQQIRDLINGAAADILAGGDGQAFQDAASQAFNDLANSELSDAGFEESMRLTEEALQLGEQEIADAASQRAKDAWGENLDAAIEDTDPCTATKEEVADLMNKLAQGMLLGLDGTSGSGGSRYDAVEAVANTTMKRMYNDAARKAHLDDLVEPVPECEAKAELEIEYIFGAAVVGMEPNASTTIPLVINWGLTPSPVSGNGQLVYDSSTTDADCNFIGQGSWAVQVKGQVDSPEEPRLVQLEITPSGSPMSFDITCTSGSRGGVDLDPNSSSISLPWQDGATVQSGYLWTFTLRLR